MAGRREGTKSSEIVVFHFLFVPELIENLARTQGHLEIPLDNRKIEQLRELARRAERYRQDFAPGMMLCYESVLIDLSILVWELHSASKRNALQKNAKERIDFAMRWYGERIHENSGNGAYFISCSRPRRKCFWT